MKVVNAFSIVISCKLLEFKKPFSKYMFWPNEE